jgi:hypothetical protein
MWLMSETCICKWGLIWMFLKLHPCFQGRILKHAGDAVAAAALADEARTMDLADRFLNSESVKRMLQADQVLFESATPLFSMNPCNSYFSHIVSCSLSCF